MHKVRIIPYSDNKIALNLNLIDGNMTFLDYNCERFTKTSLVGFLCDNYGINPLDYEIIENSKSETLLLLGNWDGQFNINKTMNRIAWIDIKNAHSKICKTQKELLFKFSLNYCSVFAQNKTQIGIAKSTECEKLRLFHENVAIILTKDNNIAFIKNNDKLSIISSQILISESPIVSGYRALKSKFNFLTQLYEIENKDSFNINNIFYTILQGDINQSLTFDEKNNTNNVFFLKKDNIKDIIITNKDIFTSQTREILTKITL